LRVLLRHMARERRRRMGDLVEAITGRQRQAVLEQRITEIRDELRLMTEAEEAYQARVWRKTSEDAA
jgi:hypothetical protein